MYLSTFMTRRMPFKLSTDTKPDTFLVAVMPSFALVGCQYSLILSSVESI